MDEHSKAILETVRADFHQIAESARSLSKLLHLPADAWAVLLDGRHAIIQHEGFLLFHFSCGDFSGEGYGASAYWDVSRASASDLLGDTTYDAIQSGDVESILSVRRGALRLQQICAIIKDFGDVVSGEPPDDAWKLVVHMMGSLGGASSLSGAVAFLETATAETVAEALT